MAKTSKKKQFLIIGLAVIAVLIVVLFFTGNDNIIALYRLHNEVAAVQRETRRAENAIDSLNKEITRLKRDTAYIEQIARERLGMAKKNEKIYKFVGQK